jgi:sodium transport system ATP-binding protein
MLAEEKEKKTFETTLLLPVSVYELTCGKWLAATAISIVSTFIYSISMFSAAMLLALQVVMAMSQSNLPSGGSAPTVSPGLLLSKTFSVFVDKFVDPAGLSAAAFAILLGTAFACAACIATLSWCKRFRDAQALCLYPMLAVMLLPIGALLPGIEQFRLASYLPLVNVMLVVKHPQLGWQPMIVSAAENAALIIVCLFLAARVFFFATFTASWHRRRCLIESTAASGVSLMLEVKGLTRYFYEPQRGEFAAVSDITFTAAPGEVFGLLGPNGAGKTTTLRMVAGLLTASAGTISIDGKVMDRFNNEARKQIGFLSATTGLYERLTPREILVYFCKLNGYPSDKIKARVEQMIQQFDMSSYADKRCEKLSTGMLQRASIARAAVHDPSLLILDEATSGLDMMAKQDIHQWVMQCRQQGKTVLFSTHLMNEAEKLCDRIGILHKGKLFAVGTLAQLQQLTGKHYLEDIFIAVVKENALEPA